AGGMAGAGNGVTLKIDGKVLDDLPNGKVTRRLSAGDSFTLLAGGGGGFGPPHERDPERVAYDVRQGYVSRRAALEHYGVAIRDDGSVDVAETAELRRL